MAEQIERRYLELIDPARHHRKFYELLRWDDHTVEVTFGPIGADGTTQIKRFASAHAAVDYMETKLNEKLNKGYRPTKDDGRLKATKPPPAPPEPLPSKAELAASFVELLSEGRSDA